MELISGPRRIAAFWSLLIVFALNAGVAFAQETAAVGKVLRVIASRCITKRAERVNRWFCFMGSTAREPHGRD